MDSRQCLVGVQKRKNKFFQFLVAMGCTTLTGQESSAAPYMTVNFGNVPACQETYIPLNGFSTRVISGPFFINILFRESVTGEGFRVPPNSSCLADNLSPFVCRFGLIVRPTAAGPLVATLSMHTFVTSTGPILPPEYQDYTYDIVFNGQATGGGSCGTQEYIIEKEVLSSTTAPTPTSADLVKLEPSNQKLADINNVVIKYTCKDKTTLEAVDGCTMKLKLSDGANDGGHSSSNHVGDRPRQLKGMSGLIVDDAELSIPKAGLEVTYEASEFSGDIKLVASAKAPTAPNPAGPSQPATITVPDTIFEVRVEGSEGWVDVSTAIPVVDIEKHGVDGGKWGTSKLQAALAGAFIEFRKKLDAYNLKNPKNRIELPNFNSQGVSLRHGGRFDVLGDWKGAHKLHRLGNIIDITTGTVIDDRYSEAKKKVIKDILHEALKRKDFKMSEPTERPGDDESRHWHAKLF
jgi:hypothetical protein